MRATIVISKRGPGYVSSATGKFGGGHGGARAGLTAYDAATHAAGLMQRYSVGNPEGGDLMAPPEVLDLVPEQLRSVPAREKSDA